GAGGGRNTCRSRARPPSRPEPEDHAMALAKYFPHALKIDFVGARYFAFALTGLLFIGVIVSLSVKGLNFGIDFQGGILIAATSQQKIDIGDVRKRVIALNLGDVQVQHV